VKKQNEVSGPYATASVTDDHGDAKDRPFHEIVPDGPLMAGLEMLERREVLPRGLRTATNNILQPSKARGGHQHNSENGTGRCQKRTTRDMSTRHDQLRRIVRDTVDCLRHRKDFESLLEDEL
jgi:hypothetical protein